MKTTECWHEEKKRKFSIPSNAWVFRFSVTEDAKRFSSQLRATEYPSSQEKNKNQPKNKMTRERSVASQREISEMHRMENVNWFGRST